MIKNLKKTLKDVKEKSLTPVRMVKDIKIRYFDFGPRADLTKVKHKTPKPHEEQEEISFLKFKLKF